MEISKLIGEFKRTLSGPEYSIPEEVLAVQSPEVSALAKQMVIDKKFQRLVVDINTAPMMGKNGWGNATKKFDDYALNKYNQATSHDRVIAKRL